MNIEEAKDILANCIADYVIGDYCVGKYCPMEDECKDKDCTFEVAIDTVLNELEKKDKVIDEMAKSLKEYANLGFLIKCTAEYDGKYNYKYCKIDTTKDRTAKTNRLCIDCIKEYFYKEVSDKQ